MNITKNLKILIIAGEASGDNIGAKLIRSLKNQHPNISFYGIGGSNMKSENFETLFTINDLSIMGFAEIIPSIPRVLLRISQTVKFIKKILPDIVITIDSPGFNFRIAAKIKKLNIKLVHYVAPTVWAYRPERAKKIAKLYDHLLVILPCERKYFIKEGLNTQYVGHPIVEDYDFYNNNDYLYCVKDNNVKSILLLPGSRMGEIKTLLPIFIEAIEILKKSYFYIDIYIVGLAEHHEFIKDTLKNYKGNLNIISSIIDKARIFPIIDAAIVKSGTISFEIAMHKIPMIIAYKINKFSAYILRNLIKIKYVNLINIMMNKMIIQEYLQEDCAPLKLADGVKKIIEDTSHRKKQIDASDRIFKILGLNRKYKPSDKAAKIILDLLK